MDLAALLRQRGASEANIAQVMWCCQDVPGLATQIAALPASAWMRSQGEIVAAPEAQTAAWDLRPGWRLPPAPAPTAAICRSCGGAFVIDRGHTHICPLCRSEANRDAQLARVA